MSGICNQLTVISTEELVRLRERNAELLQWIQVLLDQVDYTSGACSVTEMVGAVLDKSVIDEARAAIKKATP